MQCLTYKVSKSKYSQIKYKCRPPHINRITCGLVGLLTTLFHITLTRQRKMVIMLRLATHTNDVPVFSSPAFSSPAFSVAPSRTLGPLLYTEVQPASFTCTGYYLELLAPPQSTPGVHQSDDRPAQPHCNRAANCLCRSGKCEPSHDAIL